MDELIFAVILAILAALILGQVLKGILRLIAIALVGLTLVGLSITFNSPDSSQFLTNLLNPDETTRVEMESVETSSVETASAEADSRVSRPFSVGQNDASTTHSSEGAFSGADTRAGAIPDAALSGHSSSERFSDGVEDRFQPSTSDSSGTVRPLSPTPTPPPSKSRPIPGLW